MAGVLPMVFLWDSYGTAMEFLWDSYGIRMVFAKMAMLKYWRGGPLYWEERSSLLGGKVLSTGRRGPLYWEERSSGREVLPTSSWTQPFSVQDLRNQRSQFRDSNPRPLDRESDELALGQNGYAEGLAGLWGLAYSLQTLVFLLNSYRTLFVSGDQLEQTKDGWQFGQKPGAGVKAVKTGFSVLFGARPPSPSDS
jgi:hypothetical protein